MWGVIARLGDNDDRGEPDDGNDEDGGGIGIDGDDDDADDNVDDNNDGGSIEPPRCKENQRTSIWG